ncbi:MAG: glycoside hydrolase family 15 protein [Myxococcaceae bacterium]|nr:glycoside hydrolase family 15 protein [Myxococcaceae bacterium]
MALRIEDYAFVGDTEAGAIIGRDGSVDWLCLPRFDSPACFAALLGTKDHGRFLLSPPHGDITATRRRYRPGTLILETEFVTASGTVRVIDFMPPRDRRPNLIRLVEGVRGEVRMNLELIIRMDYGSIVPWVRRVDGALHAIAGPEALELWTPVHTHGRGLTTVADFTVKEGQRVPFFLAWHPSWEAILPPQDAEVALRDTQAIWEAWSAQCTYQGPYREAVLRSLVTLKGLTYAPTGGIVAAATMALPEWPGSVRNWDYRYCWLRDATLTLYALLSNGYREEAAAWRDWLLRAVAGDPAKLQIMYGIHGERRLPEYELPWLPGYEGSRPVRVGNAAASQLQLDVFGEVMDALYHSHKAGLEPDPFAWKMQETLLHHLESSWMQADEGIWEVRGGRRHFTHSKVLAWVAFDRAVKSVEDHKLEGPVDRWRALRDQIHADVCEKAYDPTRQAFMQSYGSSPLDASTLLLPLVGFLPASDPRVQGTVRAIERELRRDGFVLRYSTDENGADGLPPGEGAFLACTFWLADNYALAGRTHNARTLFERLLGIRNDLGLLAEEYDPVTKRQLGNFPQAFSHVALINTALNLSVLQPRPAEDRGQ